MVYEAFCAHVIGHVDEIGSPEHTRPGDRRTQLRNPL